MFYCTKHQTRLINSSVLVRNAGIGFYPASASTFFEFVTDDDDELMQFKDKLLRIAHESEWLIAHGLEVDWVANGYDKYWKLLRERGLAAFKGRCDYSALESAFSNYWGDDFLEMVVAETAETQFKGWNYQISQERVRRFSPLQHILLMCFLAESVSGFVSSSPADTPYGHPPFVCENPICSHYRVDGAEMVSLSYYGNGARAIFECINCGMQYKVNKSKHSRELRIVTKYGELWEHEFLRCCQDKSITNEQTAEIFKCDVSVIMLQKKKRGLLRPFHYDSDSAPIDFYKARVEALCTEHDEITRALLNEELPGAYDYLKDHDCEWLRNKVVFVKERNSVREYENELLRNLNAVITLFADNGYPKRQVTFGYVASLVGSTRDKLRCRGKMRTLLDDVIESRSDWIRRRAVVICTERKSANKTTTIKTIRREIGLHPATYAQDQMLLQDVIDTIYEKTDK
jgi:hypothetical protein